MPEPQADALALFAKAPRPGGVKTRLSGVLGLSGATEFHRQCVLRSWERLSELSRVERFLYCDGPWAEFQSVAGPSQFRIQHGEDLGERMFRCLDELLAAGFSRVLIVGSDAPTMPMAQVEEALDALSDADAVLGPSEDGGFTLVAARRTDPRMFSGVAWSQENTRAATLDSIGACGLVVTEASTWAYDIDRPRDLERLRRDPALSGGLKDWLDRRPGKGS